MYYTKEMVGSAIKERIRAANLIDCNENADDYN